MRVFIVCLLVACDAPPPPPASQPSRRSIECRPAGELQQDAHEIDVYCAHVANRCCIRDGLPSWGCNNVEYLDWYAAYCKQ